MSTSTEKSLKAIAQGVQVMAVCALFLAMSGCGVMCVGFNAAMTAVPVSAE